MNDRASRPDDERQTPSDGIKRITAPTAQDFRNWLRLHHTTARAVWLVYFKKHSATPSITWTEAVDEALCFGWIDSTARTLDADRYEQYFTRRRPSSPWSRVNKDKIDALLRAGKITAAGYAAIDEAKCSSCADRTARNPMYPTAKVIGRYPTRYPIHVTPPITGPSGRHG